MLGQGYAKYATGLYNINLHSTSSRCITILALLQMSGSGGQGKGSGSGYPDLLIAAGWKNRDLMTTNVQQAGSRCLCVLFEENL